MTVDSNALDAIVIGAGQAGLATGYHLAQQGKCFVILEANSSLGDNWRQRWDSLRLFTPAQHSALPGLANPAARNTYPNKDEFADYLQKYADRFELPVRLDVRVTALSRSDDGFNVATTEGNMTARQVVIATGPNRLPRIPEFARDLDASIRQLHSSEYQNANSIPAGDVIIIGAGTSGAEIALELATAGHRTFISGRPTPHIPNAVFKLVGGAYWAFVNSVLTLSTPIGRKVAPKFHQRGAPLIRISMKELESAGVTRLPRLTGTLNGMPDFDGTSVQPPATLIWATGYRPDLSWLPSLTIGANGLPLTQRGVVDDIPGLYFVGLPFQYALTSGLVGGVGRDAAYIAGQINKAAQKVDA
jgi:putative flavoprotein involved in K+ transport